MMEGSPLKHILLVFFGTQSMLKQVDCGRRSGLADLVAEEFNKEPNF
jgi:hypothetical protein